MKRFQYFLTFLHDYGMSVIWQKTITCRLILTVIRNGPLTLATIRKRMGGGGQAKYKKKTFAQGKIKFKKNHARQLTMA